MYLRIVKRALLQFRANNSFHRKLHTETPSVSIIPLGESADHFPDEMLANNDGVERTDSTSFFVTNKKNYFQFNLTVANLQERS